MKKERVISGYRNDIKVDDENFPEWAYRSSYAEQLWEMWNNRLEDRIEILKCQKAPEWRKYLIRRCKAILNS